MEERFCGCGMRAKSKDEMNAELKNDARRIVRQVDGYSKGDRERRATDIKAAFPPTKSATTAKATAKKRSHPRWNVRRAARRQPLLTRDKGNQSEKQVIGKIPVREYLSVETPQASKSRSSNHAQRHNAFPVVRRRWERRCGGRRTGLYITDRHIRPQSLPQIISLPIEIP